MHRTTERFWKCYLLPLEIQQLADKSFRLLQDNHGILLCSSKKVGGFWSARVGLAHRAPAVEDGNDFIWVWIGTPDEYETLIRRS